MTLELIKLSIPIYTLLVKYILMILYILYYMHTISNVPYTKAKYGTPFKFYLYLIREYLIITLVGMALSFGICGLYILFLFISR